MHLAESAASLLSSESTDETEFADRLEALKEQIAQAAQQSGRKAENITVIGVTKTQSAARAARAVRAGIRDLGENYIQEAQAKVPEVTRLLEEAAAPTWHFIGHLQSNKARFAVNFDLIHTVDGVKLAQELDRQAAKRSKVQPVLIEVNTARMPERAGVLAEDLPRLVDALVQMPSLALHGLMTIAPFGDDAEQARPTFRQMRQLWEDLPSTARQVLSMGMSGDFTVAVEEGATHVRIGTALFGTRVR